MYDTRRLRCFGPVPYSPLPHLVRTGGEEAPQVERRSHRRDDFRQGRFRPQLLAFFFHFCVVLESAQALFKANRKRNDRVASRMFFDPLGNLRKMLILLADVVLLAQVDEVDHGFGGEQQERVDHFDLKQSSARSFMPDGSVDCVWSSSWLSELDFISG